MADNFATDTAGVAASVIIATDKIGGVDYQRVKVTWGVDGTATDVAAATPLPVTLATAPLPADAATETTLAEVSSDISSILTALSVDPTAGALAGTTGPQFMARAEATVPSAVDDGDAVTVLADVYGRIVLGLATDVLLNGAAPLTPKFAKIALSASGELLVAQANKKLRVLAYNLIGNGAVNVKFQSDGSADLTGLKYIATAGGGICAPFSPVGWFETASGKSLDLDMSAAVAVGGELVYVEVA